MEKYMSEKVIYEIRKGKEIPDEERFLFIQIYLGKNPVMPPIALKGYLVLDQEDDWSFDNLYSRYGHSWNKERWTRNRTGKIVVK